MNHYVTGAVIKELREKKTLNTAAFPIIFIDIGP